MAFGGYIGILPDAVADYFRVKQKRKVTEAILYTGDLDKYIRKFKAAIITYKHSNGVHFIAVKYNSKTKKYTAYNVFTNSVKAEAWDSIRRKFSEKRYSVLYITGIN